MLAIKESFRQQRKGQNVNKHVLYRYLNAVKILSFMAMKQFNLMFL
jgi:hypothetical protein